MTENIPEPAFDEPSGDMADQASRLQALEEQQAIRAALAGHVYGSDALEDRGVAIEPLEGADPLDAESGDASDDAVYAGGSGPSEDERDALAHDEPDSLDVGIPEDGTAVATDEGSSI